MSYHQWKRLTYQIIEKAEAGDKKNLVFDCFIIALIFLNVLAIVLESFAILYDTYQDLFGKFEVFSVLVFSVEYLLRIWTADLKYEGKSHFWARIRFVFTPMAMIDLLAILPFYLPMFIHFDLRFLRMFRVIRILRVFKLNRYSNALITIGLVVRKKKAELLITVFVTLMLLLIASTLMFHLEHDVQPKAFPNIIASFWWAIATLTTVGYGDVYPITGWGRLLSGIIAMLGIGLVALPTGIISSGFMNEISSVKEDHKDNKSESEKDDILYCPYCGKRIRENKNSN